MKTLTLPGLTELSKRQQEILQAACAGLPDKLIADQLGISPRTLEGHWRAIHYKLGSVNRCQAGLTSLPCGKTRTGKSSRKFPLWHNRGKMTYCVKSDPP